MNTPPVLGGATPPADLLATAHGAAAWLARQGVTEGSRIAVDSPDVLPWLLGADLLGAATLVTEPTWTHREREAVLQDAAPSLVVSGTPAPAGSVEPCGGDPHFYLPTTSGSSGRPKVGIRTRASWLRSFAALGHVRGPVLVAGPLSSSLFLFGALHTLWCAERLWLRPRWDPGEARHACAVHVVPAMLADLVADAERRPGSSALGTVVCGGAHVAPELRKRFARAFPGARLVEYYGSAEHSLIAIRRDDGALRPVPGVELDVRDGVLWVRSPLAFSGYLREGVLDPAPEWSSVGDRVELSEQDGLVVRGRGSAVVSSGGTLVPAEEVEAVLRTVAGVDDVVVTGTPHPRLGELVTAVVQARRPPALRDLRAAARASLRPGLRPRRWLVTTALPRTASGKPARAEAAERLRDGTLAAEPLT
ncbi:class I adenylate-forming enzyme family protein [Prauserella oleivorans]|uniref:Class I adenylate-forming enzyme family protein n=1 Tax=Prauserella oleivorans TaxID=1478153 RepID=A0ABW5WH22_9PSEU